MANDMRYLSAEEEAKLLKPIDEYVGKIQAQIDALRVEGSDKVNSLKNQIAIAKENKNLTKEQQNKIIEESKKQLEKAKATEAANKEQITKLIADAEGYLSKHYNSEYYDVVAKSCEAEKKAETKQQIMPGSRSIDMNALIRAVVREVERKLKQERLREGRR